jgi:RNA polymerase sigma factor (sigma-70 family)
MKVEGGVWTATIDREGHEDMMSEGKVIFFEALHKYDPSSEVPFTAFIKSQVQFGVFNYLRGGSCFQNAIQVSNSLDEIILDGYEPESIDDVESLVFTDDNVSNSRQLALKVAWNSLNQKQKDVLDLVIHREYTLREAGAELGIHFTTVREIKANALKKMEKILKKVLK